jgi:hypothetical protein
MVVDAGRRLSLQIQSSRHGTKRNRRPMIAALQPRTNMHHLSAGIWR